jgi:REP element-mobilizing transposase RayT
MARLARVVAPGFGHHVTQRGNRRQQTFFENLVTPYRVWLAACPAHRMRASMPLAVDAARRGE